MSPVGWATGWGQSRQRARGEANENLSPSAQIPAPSQLPTLKPGFPNGACAREGKSDAPGSGSSAHTGGTAWSGHLRTLDCPVGSRHCPRLAAAPHSASGRSSLCWWPRGALGSGLLPHHPTQLWVGTSGVPTSQGCCGKDELSSVEWETEAPPRSVGLRGSVCA